MKRADALSLFRTHLAAIYPQALAGRVLESMGQPKRCAFRVNRLRHGVEPVLEQLRRDGFDPSAHTFGSAAFSVGAEARAELTRHPLVNEGAIYVQNAASQLAAPLLDPQPGESVLDLAAAPGGKALHLAERMENRGRLAVVEPIRQRFFRLRGNLERAGVTIARSYMRDGSGVGRDCAEWFDRVLLDAPCSSEARIRLDVPESYAHWSPRKVRECARKQLKLLRSALQSAKVGGRVLYCTCSFAPEENEAIVDQLLREAASSDGLGRAAGTPPFEVVDAPLPPEVPQLPGLTRYGDAAYAEELTAARRVVPDELFDGFFVCLLVRRG